MEQMDLVISTDAPPLPRPKFSEPIHAHVYRLMVRLEPGHWIRWPKAPRSFRNLVARWAKAAAIPHVIAYRDAEGDGIVLRNVPDSPIVLGDGQDDQDDDE